MQVLQPSLRRKALNTDNRNRWSDSVFAAPNASGNDSEFGIAQRLRPVEEQKGKPHRLQPASHASG